MAESTGPKPSPNVANLKTYSVPKAKAPTDLKLDSNEGIGPPVALLDTLVEAGPEGMGRYTKTTDLEKIIADKLGLPHNRVLVTAGGDDAIFRACIAFLHPGREMILPVPTFEMFPIFAGLAGGRIREVPWSHGDFPVNEIVDAINPSTGIVVVISPNNPTGIPVGANAILELSKNAGDALVLLDLAYGEFDDEDLLAVAVKLENVVTCHTLSKAWGMAGLRIGFATGPEKLIEYLRAAGFPYPVSSHALALAEQWIVQGQNHVDTYIDQVKKERLALLELLRDLGAVPVPSQANFIFSRFKDPVWLRDALAGMGIALRLIPDMGEFQGGVRISCPGNEGDFCRLVHGLKTALAPELLLMDPQTADEIGPGAEQRLQHRLPVEIIQTDSESAIRRVLEKSGVNRAIVLGQTPKTMKAARSAGTLPVAWLLSNPKNPEIENALYESGAARVFTKITNLEELLP